MARITRSGRNKQNIKARPSDLKTLQAKMCSIQNKMRENRAQKRFMHPRPSAHSAVNNSGVSFALALMGILLLVCGVG
jgi:hypothetical protein